MNENLNYIKDKKLFEIFAVRRLKYQNLLNICLCLSVLFQLLLFIPCHIVTIEKILLGKIYFEKPVNVIEAIINELKRLEKKQNENHVFSEEEIEALFRFVDLENKKQIDREKCILGLNQFVLNDKQSEHIEKMEIASVVDFETFTSYAKEIANL